MIERNGFTPFTAPEVVLEYLNSMLELLSALFKQACRQTRVEFERKGWAWDANLAAFQIRKEVFEELRHRSHEVEELDLEQRALCGLLLKMPLVQLKIRKSRDGEIPAAGSQQSQAFYNWNLLVFPENGTADALPLHLMLLWNDDRDHELSSMALVCVEGDTWRWREVVSITDGLAEITDAVEAERFRDEFNSQNQDVPMTLRATETEAGEATADLTGTASETDAAAEAEVETGRQPKKKVL